jgi:hypothetical protein
MTKEELAAKLNGNEYCQEITYELAEEAAKAGLVAVFGGSDDLIYFAGAIADERGASDGSETLILDGKIFEEPDCDCKWAAKAFGDASLRGRYIRARWAINGYSWCYETNIPHATFEILEGEETYCKGIVFALADAAA